ncbi:hypothetical protein FZC78_10355 [Rossellomorea vietnamensis]|uniref:Uncharacterized protein n=1 Tax=Rossellomorea vietnamensis TaxID=218284 RepID=A0A5D4NWB1_9BACI|nr:hypothetical protein [Rossellomorea vietnamensis]TYS17022.1 hypothetical protein FZC78_10355 [Rossellomorea vietnamensis]
MKMSENTKITVTPDYPSYLVENFRTYLNYLLTHTIKLTRRSAYFTKKDLLSLHSQMKGEWREVPNHAAQADYPILHLFYELSRVLSFIKVRRTSSTAAAIIQTDRIEDFMKLTAAEQYLSLLEAFWMEADWDELQGEKRGKAFFAIHSLFEELERFPANEVIQLKHHPEILDSVREFGSFLHTLVTFDFGKSG